MISPTGNISGKFISVFNMIVLIFFLPFLLYGAFTATVWFMKASGKPANIVVDAKTIIGPFNTDQYRAFAQGGEESADMISPVLTQVKGLKPRLIRIDHIYDHFNVVSGSSGNLSFDFSRLDGAVNTILASGAKPMLALSYMPSVIAKDGSVINPPNDWNDWALVVQRTIEHYSGTKRISGMYYEVWNEPDLAQFGGWKYQGDKNYLTLYRYAANGARNAKGTLPFSFGGPATTGMYPAWIRALAASGMRVDFFSWHSYLADPVRFKTDQANLMSVLIKFPQHVLKPTMITEFGFDGGKNKLYKTQYAAAHTAAVIRQLAVGGPKYIFSFELKDGPGQENAGGWGLISHESAGIKLSPRYYVYNFIDTMSGQLLSVSGEGSWVTGFATNDDRTIRLMLINFDTRGTHLETVPVTIMNMDPGEYVWKVKYLYQAGCSRDNPPPRNAQLGNKETLTGTAFTKQICMSPQNIAILEVTKQ